MLIVEENSIMVHFRLIRVNEKIVGVYGIWGVSIHKDLVNLTDNQSQVR